jgi:hypothetical protein
MKGVLWSLLATVIGIAMVAGGVYGVVKDVSGDDDASAATTTSIGFTPAGPDISPSSNECAQVEERDLRLADLDDRRFERSGDETGRMTVDLICNGDTVVLTARMEGLKEKDTAKYFAWLYETRRDAKQVGTLLGSGGTALGAITIGPEVDTTAYRELVITRVPFGEQERRPRKIVFRTEL